MLLLLLPDHRTLYPADVVLFEGILVLYTSEVREMLQMKLFVDTDSDTRLARRGDTPFCGLLLLLSWLQC